MKRVKLQISPADIRHIEKFMRDGRKTLNELNRCQILLHLHKGKKEKEIVDFLGIERTMLWKLKQNYKTRGIEKCLKDKPRSGQPRKYTEKHAAELTALACSNAPRERSRWTLGLLTEEMQKKAGCHSINRETVRLMLKKTPVSLGSKRCGALLK